VCVCVCERAVLCFSSKPVYLSIQNKNFDVILLKCDNLQNHDFTGETKTDVQVNTILPELHLVGLLYIIDLRCTETQIYKKNDETVKNCESARGETKLM